MKMQTCSAGYQ